MGGGGVRFQRFLIELAGDGMGGGGVYPSSCKAVVFRPQTPHSYKAWTGHVWLSQTRQNALGGEGISFSD